MRKTRGKERKQGVERKGERREKNERKQRVERKGEKRE